MPADENDAESGAEEQRRARFRVLDLSAVGLAFPVALLLGYFGGRLIGGWVGNAKVGAMIGVLVGIAGGFYNLFKMVSRLAPRTVAAAGRPPPASGPPRSRATSRSRSTSTTTTWTTWTTRTARPMTASAAPPGASRRGCSGAWSGWPPHAASPEPSGSCSNDARSGRRSS